MTEHVLYSPFDYDLSNIHAGDFVYINGYIYTGRDAAHKRLYELALGGHPLPFEIKNQAIYYVGPCPPKPGHVIGACGPTTSGRMDAYTPLLLDMGLKIMIGKGFRSEKVIKSMIKNKCLYLAAIGGAGALLSECVKKCETVAFSDLGTEAVHRFYVEDFPAIVAIDSQGQNLYAQGISAYRR